MSDSDSEESLSSQEEAVETLKIGLARQIWQIQTSGSFATSDSISDFANPGLKVAPFGPVHLPLEDAEISSLITCSRKAPFGKDGQTLVDEAVRKTWEIGASQLDFQNPKWEQCLSNVVDAAAEGLGAIQYGTKVRAELYKMLIYEEGAMFKAHQDTEKVPGMFGTLVICLPSEHTGGAVTLRHGNERKHSDISATSRFDATYMAWYADVTHEVEPVQSGHRCVLTYNLIKEAGKTELSAASLDATVARFRNLFNEWDGLADCPLYLAHKLSYEYSKKGLELSHLKGRDYHTAKIIAESCAKHGGFITLLGNVEFHEQFDQEVDLEDANLRSTLSLTRIADLQGQSFISVISGISGSDFTYAPNYENRDVDEQRGGGYMGNQVADLEEIYRDSVILIVRKADALSFLVPSENKYRLGAALSKLVQIHSNLDSDTRSLLQALLDGAMETYYSNDSIMTAYMGHVALSAMALAQAKLFADAVYAAKERFEDDVYRGFGKYVQIDDLQVPEEWLVVALKRGPTFAAILSSLDTFRASYLRSNPDRESTQQVGQLERWIDTLIVEALDEAAGLSPAEDAKAVVKAMTDRAGNGFRQFVLYQGVRKFIDRWKSNATFADALEKVLSERLERTKDDKHLNSLLKWLHGEAEEEAPGADKSAKKGNIAKKQESFEHEEAPKDGKKAKKSHVSNENEAVKKRTASSTAEPGPRRSKRTR